MSAAEPDYAKSMRAKKDSPWYLENIEKNLNQDSRRLLEEYSHIPPEQVVSHIHEIRDKAWDIRAYPCTGLGRWLVPTIDLSAAYPDILARIKAGATLLDVGVYLGQDLRKLAYDGAPTRKLIGVDIADLWDTGFEMYRDREKFSARFIEADILGSNSELLALKNSVDVIWASQVLHQWSWEQQVACCRRLVELSKAGGLIVGLQIGHEKGHAFEQKAVDEAGKKMPAVNTYWQSPETVRKLWDEVAKETGAELVVKEARLRGWAEVGWDPADQRFLPAECGVLDYVVERVK